MPVLQNDIWDKMVQKILHDPDKFERMFAARYLSKYKYTEIKAILINLLEDDDLEVVMCGQNFTGEERIALTFKRGINYWLLMLRLDQMYRTHSNSDRP